MLGHDTVVDPLANKCLPMFDERVERAGMHFSFKVVVLGYNFGFFWMSGK